MSKGSAFALGIIAGIGVMLLAAILGWLAVVYTGAYNVAATDRHADIARWTLDTTMRRSVSVRAADLDVPRDLPPELVAAGAPRYAAMCAHCHAGPGIDRAGWASGMRPLPPDLTEAAAQWDARQVFWIVRHGIKMSGMPAFGPDHGEEALLQITAFVKQLPGMTPEQYQALTGSADHGHGGGHGHEAGGHQAGVGQTGAHQGETGQDQIRQDAAHQDGARGGGQDAPPAPAVE